MDDAERRALLEAVARGEVTPEEAAERLQGRGAERADHTDADETAPRSDGGAADRERPAPAVDRSATGRRVRVEATAGAVRVLGDPTVALVDVEGAHDLHEEGDTVVVRCQPLRDLDLDFDLDWGRPGNRTFVIQRRHAGRSFAVDDLKRRVQVTVRMNPAAELDVHVAAGAVNVRGIDGPITCDVDAGAARLRDVRGPLRCNVNAGSLSVDGRLTEGSSHISCDMGAASVRLDRASDVRVSVGPVNLGRCDVQLPDGMRSEDGEFVLGNGRASLDIEGSMSAVSVRVR